MVLEASATTETTTGTAASPATRTSTAPAATASTAAKLARSTITTFLITSAKEIEAVDDVQHSIRINVIIPGVATHISSN